MKGVINQINAWFLSYSGNLTDDRCIKTYSAINILTLGLHETPSFASGKCCFDWLTSYRKASSQDFCKSRAQFFPFL